MTRNAAKRVMKLRKPPADSKTSRSFDATVPRAVRRANQVLVEAGVELDQHAPTWAPNQLRHARGTEVRRRFGLGGVQTVLGHANARTSEIYAERDLPRRCS